jgi:hypothetical protein
LKKFLSGRRFKSDEEVKDAVKEWVKWTTMKAYNKSSQAMTSASMLVAAM